MDDATNSSGNSSSSNSKNHYLRQTIAGVVCTKCIIKVNTSNTLFCINRRTIDRHWREKGCSDGNQRPATTATQLEIRLKELHTRSQNNPALAMSDFREGDKGVTKTTRFYCDRCGLLDEPKRLLLRHCAGVGKGKCPGKPVRGPVLFNKYKLHMPIQFINDIVNGRSPVPHVRKSIVIPHVMTSAIHAPSQSLSAATAIAAPDMTTAVAANAATTTMTSCRRPPKRIRVSDTEMTKALKPVISSYPD